ncbi:M4 family metallopeptidase [Methanosarcina sp.]|uniref:M4 family metallopeptidase n=1 Tax=Methanosarcina sp. TaxID=2213 RepID=UPI003C78C501
MGDKNLNHFTNSRARHKCFCTFVPSFILENPAKAGVEDATLTIHQDRSSRKERASEVPDIGTLMGVTADDADWLIGDEIMGPKLYGEALRCMAAPGTAYDNELMGKDLSLII